jgi:hypothetical protein
MKKPNPPIAVVGVSALFPGSSMPRILARHPLRADLITDVPATHWLIDDYYDPDPAAPDKTYAKRGAFLSRRRLRSARVRACRRASCRPPTRRSSRADRGPAGARRRLRGEFAESIARGQR